MLLPNRGAEAARRGDRTGLGRPGIRGVLMGCYPNGTLESPPRTTRCGPALAEAGVPLNIHVSLSQHMPAAHRAAAARLRPLLRRARTASSQMIFAGVFDRFPALNVVVAEVDCGWVPYFKEQIDNNYRRLARGQRLHDHRAAERVRRAARALHVPHRPVRHREPRTRSASSASSGRATTRTSRATGPTRGQRSTRRSPASPPPSATRSSPATPNASTASAHSRKTCAAHWYVHLYMHRRAHWYARQFAAGMPCATRSAPSAATASADRGRYGGRRQPPSRPIKRSPAFNDLGLPPRERGIQCKQRFELA